MADEMLQPRWLPRALRVSRLALLRVALRKEFSDANNVTSMTGVLSEKKGEFPFTTEQMEEPRQNMEVFSFMVDYFWDRYLGKHFGQLRKRTTVSELLSVTDEAFILLNLKNNLPRWLDQHKIKEEWDKKVAARTLTEEEQKAGPPQSTVYSVYTRAGKNNVGFTCKSAGWNNEGIKEFNRLCAAVQAARKNDSKKQASIEGAYIDKCAQRPSPYKQPKPTKKPAEKREDAYSKIDPNSILEQAKNQMGCHLELSSDDEDDSQRSRGRSSGRSESSGSDSDDDNE